MSKTILLKIDTPALDALEKFLWLRKVTDNTIGPDYDFGAGVVKAIAEGKKEIQIFVGKR